MLSFNESPVLTWLSNDIPRHDRRCAMRSTFLRRAGNRVPAGFSPKDAAWLDIEIFPMSWNKDMRGSQMWVIQND